MFVSETSNFLLVLAQCGRGFFRESASLCTKCSIGEYQDELGQSGCTPCPTGKSTKYRGAKSIDECLGAVDLTVKYHVYTRKIIWYEYQLYICVLN